MPAPHSNRERFEEPAANVYTGVHRVLTWGMTASTVLYAAGALRALQHPLRIPLHHNPMQSAAGIAAGLLRLDPISLMLLATLLLILTPVTRVIVSFIAFWHDGDHRFAGVTAIVFGVILLTVALGALGLH